MADINVYGTLKSMAEDQKVAYAKQVFDEDLNKDQHTINLELDEKIEGKVEDLRDEVFGDEWVDEIHGRRFLSLGSEYGWYRNYSVLRKNSTLVGDWNANVIGFKVKAGDKFRLVGISTNTATAGWNTAPMACFYDIYEVPTASGSSPSNYTFPNAQYVGSYSPEKERPIDDIVEIPQGVEMVVFMATKSGVVSSGGYMWYSADDLSSCYRYLGNTLSIADKTGYKISTWTDDEIITSTSLAVGSVVPYWSDGTRYGGRGVRLNVKEGDKVLLDTYSPALYGLIFTDENRVVKALYDDRRFDGVWTAPVNGYCYIQDVLYRENYHYASAHGHLAYMAHDARKRVAKGGDWYNEFMPRRMRDLGMLPKVIEAGDTNRGPWYIESGNTTNLTMKSGTFELEALQVKIEGEEHTNAWVVPNYGSSKTNLFFESIYCTGLPKTAWTIRIYRCNANASTTTNLALGYNGTAPSQRPSFTITILKTFVHTSSDFGELYALAQKIINGEVEVDNFYGVREKEVDLVRNAIGLQSISDLGYNILNHGATLPIDEEGYKYAKELYERYKDNPPRTFNRLFYNNEDLVYSPEISLENFDGGGNSCFEGCHNLISVQDFEKEGFTIALTYMFRNCWSLKRVGDIKMNVSHVTRAFENCYALEYIGRIATTGDAIRTGEKSGAFYNCYSLERIEELNMYRWGGSNLNHQMFQNCVNLRYLLIKGFGSWSVVTWTLQNALANWGIPNDKHPDARQSLVDSLLTYSYDRVNDPDGLGTAGTTCTITLSANTYNQLTTSEIEAITAKGYTLTHP